MKKVEYKIIKNLNGDQKRRFANCFLVQDHSTPLQYVLKISRPNTLPHLQKESLFTFDHESFPKVINFYENKQEGELLLAFKTGIPILKYYKTLSRSKRIPFLTNLIEQITALLILLNQNKIVHLDIKPSNILFDDHSDCFHIIDFGLAEYLPAPRRKILFPLGYASPEFILGHSDCYSLGTDLFALGATIYHLYTSKIPLTHPNPSIFTNLQLAHPIERPGGMPKPLYEIIKGFMKKPQWKTAPNRMNAEEVKLLIIESIKKREESLLTLSHNLKQLTKPNRLTLLIKFFSKPNV